MHSKQIYEVHAGTAPSDSRRLFMNHKRISIASNALLCLDTGCKTFRKSRIRNSIRRRSPPDLYRLVARYPVYERKNIKSTDVYVERVSETFRVEGVKRTEVAKLCHRTSCTATHADIAAVGRLDRHTPRLLKDLWSDFCQDTENQNKYMFKLTTRKCCL